MTFEQLLHEYYELNPTFLEDTNRPDVEAGMRFVYEEMQSAAIASRGSTSTIPRASLCDADDPAYIDA